MLPYSFVGQGTYVNGASLATVNVALNDRPDWFYVKDITNNSGTFNWGKASTAILPLYAEWYSNMAAGSYLAIGQISASAGSNYLYPSSGASGGFTFINGSNPPSYTSLTQTGINDSTFVVTMSNTGSIAVGDYVRLINPAGQLQLGGLVAQVTAVTANTSITLGYIATAVSAGLTVAANSTGGSILKFIPGRFYPKAKQILYVTQATQAKVYFASQNDFTPGQMVDFTIPSAFGMIQLNSLTAVARGPARVLVVTNSSTESSITLDLDTTGYTAFNYPASASIQLGGSPPLCMPAGSGIVPLNGSATVPQSPPGTNLQDAFDNRNQYYMSIGTSACGIASATMEWFAFKADYTNLTNA